MKAFICYEPGTAQKFVDALAARMARINCVPVIINLQTMYGHRIKECVGQATANCDKVIVALNRAFVASDWHVKELYAFQLCQDRQQRPGWIVPVMLDDCHPPPLLDAAPIDFRNWVDASGRVDEQVMAHGFEHIRDHLYRKPQAFIAMKFGSKVLDAMCKRTEHVFRAHGYETLRIDQIPDAGDICGQIRAEVARSEVVMVDLTGSRPNCYYEAGYADALEKQMIFSARQGTKPHFDIATRRYIPWVATRLDEFATTLERFLEEIARRRDLGAVSADQPQAVPVPNARGTASADAPRGAMPPEPLGLAGLTVPLGVPQTSSTRAPRSTPGRDAAERPERDASHARDPSGRTLDPAP